MKSGEGRTPTSIIWGAVRHLPPLDGSVVPLQFLQVPRPQPQPAVHISASPGTYTTWYAVPVRADDNENPITLVDVALQPPLLHVVHL